MRLKLIRKFDATRWLAAPALAGLLVTSAQAAQVGINFQDSWGTAAADGGAAVTTTAFGIDVANWYNVPLVPNSESTATKATNTVTLADGNTLEMVWSCVNTYSITADIPTAGDDQVVYGYLDDTGAGYSVTITGFRKFASSYTIKTIASSDNATGFQDAVVSYQGGTNNLQYLSGYPLSYGTGFAAESTVSPAIATLGGNDKIQIRGLARNDTLRSTLAAIIIDYTPGANNPPLIETQPVAPTGNFFAGSTLTLTASASGSPVLGYQWRKDGNPINGATSATYTKANVTSSDSGTYTLVVTNSLNSATSSPVVVTVTTPIQPVITQAPISQNVFPGYPVTFKATATGGGLIYTWKKGSTVIPGATTDTLTLNAVTAQDADTYTVTVNNPVGSASASATLGIRTPVSAYEGTMAQLKPALWFRMSDTGLPVQDVVANSGSLGTAGRGLYLGNNTHPAAGAIAGSTDTAASFSGGRVTVAYNASLNTDTFTVEAWLKPDAELTGSALTCPLSSVHIADPRAGWLIYQSPTGWNLRTYNQNGTAIAANATGGPAPVAGQWYHVVASWNGSVAKVYVNGVLSATSPVATYVANADGAFTVGARNDGAFAWSGTADEVAYYAGALSDAQILAHYQNGTNANRTTAYSALLATDGAVEYLKLNEAAFGGIAPNYGTLGVLWNGAYADGTGVLGSPGITLGEAGPALPGFEAGNKAVSMVNGYVKAPRIDLANNVTVTCWINRNDPSTSGDLSWPAWLGDGGFHMNADGELRYHWKGGNWNWSSGLRVPVGQWTFAALVVEPTKATIYMSSGQQLLTAVNTATHAPMATTSPVGFGGNQPDRADRTYIGKLDESSVFDRALSANEVGRLFAVATAATLRMDMQPGGIIDDVKPSGTPHYGFNYGATWLPSVTDEATVPVTRTGVLQFTTATGSQILTPADADFNGTAGSFAFWMRANAPIPGPGQEGAILVDRRTTNGTVIVLNDGGSLFIQCANQANSFTAPGYLPDNLWHHVVVTYDQSATGSITVYIDGVNMGSQLNSKAWAWPTTAQIEIGRSHDGYWKRFDGFMDDFRIYNRILTDSEVTQLYSTGAVVDSAALKLRYDFKTIGIGETLTWPFGLLESSPVLGPNATWTEVPGASSPQPVLPNQPALFYRVKL